LHWLFVFEVNISDIITPTKVYLAFQIYSQDVVTGCQLLSVQVPESKHTNALQKVKNASYL